MHFIWLVYAAHMIGYWATVIASIAWDRSQCDAQAARNKSRWPVSYFSPHVFPQPMRIYTLT